jgi:PTH1 family peptidyl-tRNA hydrolase
VNPDARLSGFRPLSLDLDTMKLIAGLGNPGREYALTRHNAGFMVLDRLAVRHRLSGARVKFNAGVLEGAIAGERCLLMQPTTYMNRSGLAIGEAAAFFKLTPDDLLIVVDDTALPLGRLRLRGEGSAGSHNGLKDIERVLGTRAYPRLRVGVDPPPPRVRLHDWVLGRFTEQERERLPEILDRACDCIDMWIGEGIAKTASRFNADAGSPG